MANRLWRGDAPPQAMVRKFAFSGQIAETSDVIFKINRKPVYVQAGGDTVQSLVDACVATLGLQTNPVEFTEGVYTSEQVGTGDPYLLATAATPGVPIDITAEAPYPTVDVDTIQDGGPGQNEIQQFHFSPTPTGGEFTVIWNFGSGPETSTNIPAGSASETVKNAMIDGMASLNPGDINVTGLGTAASPYKVEATGAYAQTAMADIGVDVTNLTGNGQVAVSTVQQAGAGTSDAVWLLLVDKKTKPTATHWWFSFKGVWVQVAFGSDAATVKTKLELLSSIGSGNVDVYGGSLGGDSDYEMWVVKCKGILGGKEQPLPLLNASMGGVGPASFIGVTNYLNPGGIANNDELFLIHNDATGGTFTVTVGANTTAALPYNISRFNLQTAIEGLASVGSGNVLVYDHYISTSEFTMWGVLFTGSLSGTNVSDLTVDGASLTGETSEGVIKVQDGSATSTINEKQSVYTNGAGGSFTLSLGGQTTAALSPFSTTGQIKSALDALSSIDSVTVTGNGTTTNPWIVEFGGTQAGLNVAQMTGNGSLLTGGFNVAVVTTQEGIAATGTIWHVTIWNASSGNFQLGFLGDKTGNIAFGANAATVDAALEALGSIPTGEVSVSGDGTSGTPYVITVSGSLAGVIHPQLIAYNEDLVGTSITITVTDLVPSRGPNHWDDPLNWMDLTTGDEGIPEDGDNVFLQRATVFQAILYGLDQTGITLNSLIVDGLFESYLGNSILNPLGYSEYRDTHLKIGLQGDRLISIGGGQGSGSQRLNIDTAANQTNMILYKSQGGTGQELYAVNWKGSHASNIVDMFEGTFSAALNAGEVAQFLLRMRGGVAFLGRGVDLTGLEKTGGTLLADNAKFDGNTFNLQG